MNWPKKITIFLMSILVSLINIILVLIGATKIPTGSQYLAVGHFYYDYFEYINQIVQGMRGRLTVGNPFTPFDHTETVIGWGQYLLYGRIAAFLHWSPYLIYWVLIFIGAIILCLLLFIAINKIFKDESFYFQFSSWLIVIFAAPFVTISTVNGLKIDPYDFWYAPMSLFHRFGGVPHQLLSSILTVVLLIAIANIISDLKTLSWMKLTLKTFLVSMILIFLLTFAPFQVINIVSSLMVTVWIFINILIRKNSKQELKKLIYVVLLILILIVPAGLVIRMTHDNGELFKRAIAWETAQERYPGIGELLLTTGPILLFIPFAVRDYFRKVTPLKLLLFFFSVFCYLYLYTPVAVFFGTHNRRFLSPVAYLSFGVLAIQGIKKVSSWFANKKAVFIIITAILIGYFLFVTFLVYESFYGVDQLSYMPEGLITGIKTLEKDKDKKVILTSPRLALGVILPSIIDKKVYLGRPIFTPDFDKISNQVDQIYLGKLPSEDVKKIFKDNDIGYVIFNPKEGYDPADLDSYQFLKRQYENGEVIIYKVL